MGLKALGLVWAPSKHSVNTTSQYYRPDAVAVDAAGGGRRPARGMLPSVCFSATKYFQSCS